jgi:hypothetical protein
VRHPGGARTLAPTRRPKSIGHGVSLLICCKCMLSVLSVIRGMLLVFHMDVAKVDRDVEYIACASEICYKCFRGMMLAFVQNISYVSDVCYKRFLFGCCTCFTHMLQGYVRNVQLFQSYVAISVFIL